jgi:hypothetical protein
VVISDGFSCRSQIRNTTGRDAIHLAQWLDRRSESDSTQASQLPTRETEKA